MTDDKSSPAILGWWEWVSLPVLGLGPIKAKCDTGAKTSSLHACNIVEYINDIGELWVQFHQGMELEGQPQSVELRARVKDRRKVKNSGGSEEERYVIESMLRLGGEAYPIELTLAARTNMRFPMLLGRSAIANRFLVDCRSSCLLGGDQLTPPTTTSSRAIEY